ncbi:MAG: SPOR domain-containing protein [Rhodospirillales bacterium]|nr:SPOR domain-containing protein [Rhodospirillales bacterium]
MIRAERPVGYDDRGELEVAPPPRRWGRFLFLFVLAVILVGGGAWAWLVHGKRITTLLAGGGGDGVPVVRADPAPFKVRPRDPGGMEVPDRDKLIYERLQGEGAETRVERLLPPAEDPLRPPRATPAPQVTERLSRTPTEAQVLAAKRPPPALDLSTPAPGREPAPEDSPPTDIETAPVSVSEQSKEGGRESSVLRGQKPRGPASPPAPPPATETAAAPETAVAPPAAQAAPTEKPSAVETSGYLIQIAAVREPERAEAEWNRLVRQHPETLRGLKLFVARADLGDKGVFWRLRAGPFPDETAAKNRCAELAKRKVGCLVVKAQG